MTNSRQSIKYLGILIVILGVVWLNAPWQESHLASLGNANEVKIGSGNSGIVPSSSSNRIISNRKTLEVLPRSTVEDRWKEAAVLLSRAFNHSPDGSRYLLRRIVEHPGMRFPILVEEVVYMSLRSGAIVSREVVSERAAAHLLLTPKHHVTEDVLRKAIGDHGLLLGERVSSRGPYRVAIPDSILTTESVFALVADLNSGAYSNIVAHADYDFVRRVALVPNDEFYSSGDQWGLENDGSGTGSRAGIDIGALEGWEVRTDASNVVVAVVDTGVRYTHEDLKDNIWINSGEIEDNDLDDDGNGYVDDVHGINTLFSSQLSIGGDPMDDHGHGTHVAGTIGARGNNDVGITGVAWKVQLMPLKFLGENGSGMDSDAIKCIDYAISNGADIINNSWGGEGVNKALANAVERANLAGVLFVVAAGNGGDNIDIDSYTPAGIDLPNVLTVANHDNAGDLQISSNYGREKVDIVAPGTRIRSATHRTDESYGFKSGTSMAAPHVSGVLALLKAEYPEDDHIKLKERVLQGAVPDDRFEQKVRTAARLNLATAFEVVDFVPPSPSGSLLTNIGGQALLTWEHNWSESIDGYRVEKRVDERDWEVIGFMRPERRQFADPNQHPTSNIAYRVVSTNKFGDSLPSHNQVLNTVVEGGSVVDIVLPEVDEETGYGSDIDSSQTVLVVGAHLDDDAGDEAGSVYVYERTSGSGWQYRQKLLGTNGKPYDNFGYSVSISESTLAVGAHLEDDLGIDSGAVYLFDQDEKGTWTQSERIVPVDGEPQDKFGFSVDVHGKLLVVSARDSDDSGPNSGAVYVFEKEGDYNWAQKAKLVPPPDSQGEYFGWSVSTDGERIVIGAKGDDAAGIGVGSVYVYHKNGIDWNLEQKLIPENFSNYDAFGTSVDFDGTSIVVGTPNDDGLEIDTGSVSLYQYSGTHWEKVRAFELPDAEVGERFGFDVAVLGNRVAAVGVTDDGLEGPGLIFEEIEDGVWSESGALVGQETSTLVGSSITLSDQVISLGVPSERRLRSIFDIPESPKGVRISRVSEAGVSLSWSESGLSADSVAVERREVGEIDWSVLAITESGESGFVDHSAIGGRKWEYRVRAISGGVSDPSSTVTTSLLPIGRLVNLSVRGYVGEGERVLVPGFTVVGTEDLDVAIRARGPSLVEFLVPSPILDPEMTVFPLGQDSIGWSDNWSEDYSVAEMERLERETGASSVAQYPNEAVFLSELSTGVYSAVIQNSGNEGDLGLAEIYEVPSSGEYDTNAALVNLSARGFVDSGANVLIGGFVIAGDAPVRVLLRGVGPGLREFGVVDILDQPRITVYDVNSSPIVSNEYWGLGGQIAEIIELSSAVGAFDLKLGSDDSALVVTLPPGLYTCILDTESGDKGVGLLEVYLAP